MWKRIFASIWDSIIVLGQEKKIMPSLENLNSAINRAITNEEFNSIPGTTYCNQFCQQILNDLGCHDLDGLMARDMGQKILALITQGYPPCLWLEMNASQSVEKAKSGIPVLGWAAIEQETHGHVVIIAPEDMELSTTFGCDVPMCASIAPAPFKNRIMKISEAYRKENSPRYFAWLG
jgi:hypothetical protein